jgi:hypothetical protein
MGLEPLSWQILAICSVVAGGVALASYGEVAFSAVGFALVSAAWCV